MGIRLCLAITIAVCINATSAAESDGDVPVLPNTRAAPASRPGKIDRRLHAAVMARQTEDVRALVEAGLDPNARDAADNTPLIYAVADGRPISIVQLLVEHGADVNAFCNGTTPLHWASSFGDVEVVAYLLKHGADIGAKDRHIGYTPLHAAAAQSNKDVIALLLTAGADATATAADGSRPVDMVRGSSVELLRVVDAELVKPKATFPLADVNSNIVSIDGSSYYRSTTVAHVNLWSLLVYHWPETAATLLTPILIWGVVLAVRRRRRQRTWEFGQPYCRRCNYRLSGLASDRCPECGSELSRPHARVVASRAGVMRRVMWPSAVVATLATTTFVGGRFAHTRSPAALPASANWFQWKSRRAYEFAKARGWRFVLPHSEKFDVVQEFDLKDGRPKRELEGCLDLKGSHRLVVSSTGEYVAVTEKEHIRCWDTRSGKVHRTFTSPAFRAGTEENHLWVGQTSIIASAYNDRDGRYSLECNAWNIRTGQPEPLPPGIDLEHSAIVSRGERALLYTVSKRPYRLDLIDWRSGRTLQSFTLPNVANIRLLALSSAISADGLRLFSRQVTQCYDDHHLLQTHFSGFNSEATQVCGIHLGTGKAYTIGPFSNLGKGYAILKPLGVGRYVMAWRSDGASQAAEIWDVENSCRAATLDLPQHRWLHLEFCNHDKIVFATCMTGAGSTLAVYDVSAFALSESEDKSTAAASR